MGALAVLGIAIVVVLLGGAVALGFFRNNSK